MMRYSFIFVAAVLAGGQVDSSRFDPFAPANQAPPLMLVEKVTKVNDGLKQKDGPEKSVKSANEVIQFHVEVTPKEVKRGEVTRVVVTGLPAKNWHTYSMTVKTPDQQGLAVSKFKIVSAPGLAPLGPIDELPPPVPVFEDKTGWLFEHSGKFTWSFDLLVTPEAQVGPAALKFQVGLQVCSTSCVPGDITLVAGFVVQGGDALVVPDSLKVRSETKFPPPAKLLDRDGHPLIVKEQAIEPKAKDDPNKTKAKDETSPQIKATIPADYADSMARVTKQIIPPEVKPNDGLVTFMLTGMFWGFISLITPCVFPMIPITVSFFLKQSEKEHHKPVAMAAVYCGTIVVVLTVAAAALLNFFRFLSINPLMNFALGGLFIFFALSLFGMYEIELPSFLARYTSEREGRGGTVGTIFMALTFTIISFACVAPFLGGFGGTADTATRPFWQTILGGLAFSVTFAAPFFVLALFPTLLKSMPKSGAWLNSVKVVMGFLELIAALKFLRAGDLLLASPLDVFTFDFVLGLSIALFLLCGCYLLGLYRLPHDSPVEHLSVPRLAFAFAFLGMGLYLMPALVLKPAPGEAPRPSGELYAWFGSFLLPDPLPMKDGESWTPNLEQAIAEARDYRQKTGKAKFLFIDFTGENCNNCRKNEQNVFTNASIQKLLRPYTLVKLYTDTIPRSYYVNVAGEEAEDRRREDAKLNEVFELQFFGEITLPLYAILEPLADGQVRVLGKYRESLILSTNDFAEFLRKPQQAVGPTVASR